MMMSLLGEAFSVLSSNPLLSTIFTLYTLLLLYFPFFYLQFVYSPVIISTTVLLLHLLRLGAAQQSRPQFKESDPNESSSTQPSLQKFQDLLDCDHSLESESRLSSETGMNKAPNTLYPESFVEWDVRAPLEVIYEEYEGEEADENDDGVSEGSRESQTNVIHRYASLSLYYPESESDDSSDGDYTAIGDWDSPENMCFRWDEEDDRDGLIEIALDQKMNSEVEEDNMIEIDISPAH